MRELTGKTAVVTGAASGMGRAFADRFARSGMNVVMSDIERPRLDEAVAAVSTHGTQVIGVVADVADGDSVDALGAATIDVFGTAHVVCNNAGVAGGITDGGLDVDNWKWVVDVNLWGVIHGHRVFLPMMVEQGEGHIVNTASMAGHFAGHSGYTASKWAVVGITLGPVPRDERRRDGRRCVVPVSRLGQYRDRQLRQKPARMGFAECAGRTR